MFIRKLHIKNIRTFKFEKDIELSKQINIFTGINNSGKTTLLDVVKSIQFGLPFDTYQRQGESDLEAVIYLDDLSNIEKGFPSPFTSPRPNGVELSEVLYSHTQAIEQGLVSRILLKQSNSDAQKILKYSLFSQVEPHNLLFAYSARRKITQFTEKINISETSSVRQDFSNIYPKLDEILDAEHPNNREFLDFCIDSLGFRPSSFSSLNGKKTGLRNNTDGNIPISQMGDGVLQLLGMAVDIVRARNKVFIIEEIENDIHPIALKSLLRLIIKASSNNQFILSTHSNIVLRYLGGVPDSKIYESTIEFKPGEIPISQLKEIVTEADRYEVLTNLGYEISDFGLYDAWIFFEESSAERIVREYFLKWFTPSLIGKVRTFGAKGTSDLEIRFVDFERLFTFIHLEGTIYKDKAWIIADGDDAGKKVIKELQENYATWDSKHFQNIAVEDFELYYPEEFSKKFVKIKTKSHDGQYEEKKDLTNEVLDWINEDENIAKAHFKVTAKDLIDMLKVIEKKIVSNRIKKQLPK